jgi:asparagine synthase (glutamine-hydrolysing)
MCGITGFTQFSHRFGGKEILERMGHMLKHRGPDAGGVYLDQHIGLCHRRLSIIDLSSSGNQPMYSHDERYCIVFNGEIYNFLDLRNDLLQQGYPFQTQTDTEIILALYAQFGTDLLERINGMFAFALWDKEKEKLFIARDRIGKKPLYYYRAGNDIVFGSELKAMLVLPEIPREIRIDALYDYFAYQYVPDPKTIFKDIYKLEPGHYLEIDATTFLKKQYWDVSFANVSDKNDEELKSDLRQLLDDCTQKRMISDVPLGAFLSGGVDSSIVVSLMAKNSQSSVTTCSIGFDVEKFNETQFARVVADRFQTNHYELNVHTNVRDNLEHIVSFFDEPFSDPSLVPTYFVSELARQKVTVAVAGDGGDEVFAGYQKYTTDYIENEIRNKFPLWVRSKIFPLLSHLFARINLTVFRKASSLLKSLSLDPAMGFYISNSQITDDTWEFITLEQTRSTLNGYHPSSITTDCYAKSDGKDHLSRILYTDLKTYLPGDILVKVDRMSMANSLEVRAPILDYKLIEFSASLRPELKFKKGEKKVLLKEAFKDDLPNEILYRKKMGFSVPLADWLRGELRSIVESTLFKSADGISRYFNMTSIRQLWQQHLSEKNDHSTIIWNLLIFQLWWNRYMLKHTDTP